VLAGDEVNLFSWSHDVLEPAHPPLLFAVAG
jgi:hypothetical protein